LSDSTTDLKDLLGLVLRALPFPAGLVDAFLHFARAVLDAFDNFACDLASLARGVTDSFLCVMCRAANFFFCSLLCGARAGSAD